MYVYSTCSYSTCRGQKRALDPSGTLQMVVLTTMWMPEIEPVSSGKATHTLAIETPLQHRLPTSIFLILQLSQENFIYLSSWSFLSTSDHNLQF